MFWGILWEEQGSARSKPTTEFAQPRLSRVKGRSSPARGYNLVVFVRSYMAGHYPGILMTGHIGTNTPQFVPPRWGRPPYSNGAVQIQSWVWSALKGNDSHGDSELILRDSTLLRFNSVLCFSLRGFWRFLARDAENCAVCDSRFWAAKGQHLPALEVCKNQSPTYVCFLSRSDRVPNGMRMYGAGLLEGLLTAPRTGLDFF